MFRAACCIWLAASSWAASPSDLAVAALLPPHLKILVRSPVGVDLDFVAALGNPKAPSTLWDQQTKLGLFLQSRSQARELHRLAILDGHPAGVCQASVVSVSTGEFILACTRAGPEGSTFHERFLYDLNSKTLRGSVRTSRLGINRLELQHDHIAFSSTDGESYSFLADAPSTLFRAQLSAPVYRFGPRQAFTLERSARKGVWSITERSGGKPQYHPFPPLDYLNAPESIGPWQIYKDDLYFASTFPAGSAGKAAFGRFDTAARHYEMQSPAGLPPQAATAIFVSPTHIYLGLSGWLVIWDRSTQALRSIPFPATIHALLAHNGHLYVGSAAGLGILVGEEVLHYFIHPEGPQLREYLSPPVQP